MPWTKHEVLSLKSHPETSERTVHELIADDPSMLGLGDVELITSEKSQPRAGRLDILLYDDALNRRYEVELMLGKTDPSHIIRCIEYWDIERRRYPAYDHVAVIVAEDITTRFLNVMSLFAGSIPLIAIQMSAIKIGDVQTLQFTHVLNQTALREDDTYEANSGEGTANLKDREYWRQKVPASILELCDQVLAMTNEVTGTTHDYVYMMRIINLVYTGYRRTPLWIAPQNKQIKIGGYVEDPEAWVKKLDDLGLNPRLKRGNRAVAFAVSQEEMNMYLDEIKMFIAEAHEQSS